jgi:molecular chaperone GrpE
MSKKHEDKKEEKLVKKEEYDALKDLATQLENSYKRSVADYQNLEKRIAEGKSSWVKAANKDLLLKLLPGLDSLLLAQKHTQDLGVKLSIKHFLDILEQEGVKRIDTIGNDFDPNLMEALTTAPGDEGKVIEETRAGYSLYGQVLRPAQVIVGKGAN